MLRLHGPVYQFGVRDKISNVRGTNIFFMLSPEAICMDSPVLRPFLVGQGLPKGGLSSIINKLRGVSAIVIHPVLQGLLVR